MNELSLHILDICQNSIKANANIIEIIINEDHKNNLYQIIIHDNGCGMNEKTLSEVSDPFYTTRTTRKVGLGVSLFKMAAELTDGSFEIKSELKKGTSVIATFVNNHINRAPLGKIEESIMILALNEAEIDIYYEHNINQKQYVFDTRKIREVLEGIPFTNYDVIIWMKNNIKQGINEINKEESQ